MKNIHILPSRNPSGIHFYDYHITSDEEIKEGDLWLNLKTNDIDKCTHKSEVLLYNSEKYQHIKKIILTTDPNLIKEGVQPIPDEFLEWFVKNPKCEEVKVNDCSKILLPEKGWYTFGYEIIIPTEEWISPMQQFKLRQKETYTEEAKELCGETLEEAAKKFYEDNID